MTIGELYYVRSDSGYYSFFSSRKSDLDPVLLEIRIRIQLTQSGFATLTFFPLNTLPIRVGWAGGGTEVRISE